MPITAGNEVSEIGRLFEEAQRNGDFQFLYTLVRVDGIQCWEGYEDEFLQLRKHLNDPSFTCSLDHYHLLTAYPGPFNLLQNLVNCAQKQLYDVSPLRSLIKGSSPHAVRPTPQKIVDFITTSLQTAGYPDLASLVAAAYLPKFSGETTQNTPDLPPAFDNLRLLLTRLLDRYYGELKSIQKERKYIRLSGGLDVLELLSDDEMGGLCGLV